MRKQFIIIPIAIMVVGVVVGMTSPARAKEETTQSQNCQAMTNSLNSPTTNCPTSTSPKQPTPTPVEEKQTNNKTTIKKQWTEKLEQRASRLEGKRLQKCEQRQTRINEFITRSVSQGKAKLAVFEKIDNSVRDFYTTKNLSSPDYATKVKTADEARAAVSAALDAMSTTTFSCTDADGAHPAGIIQSMHTTKHQSFVAYRQAIIDLIHTVKGVVK